MLRIIGRRSQSFGHAIISQAWGMADCPTWVCCALAVTCSWGAGGAATIFSTALQENGFVRPRAPGMLSSKRGSRDRSPATLQCGIRKALMRRNTPMPPRRDKPFIHPCGTSIPGTHVWMEGNASAKLRLQQLWPQTDWGPAEPASAKTHGRATRSGGKACGMLRGHAARVNLSSDEKFAGNPKPIAAEKMRQASSVANCRQGLNLLPAAGVGHRGPARAIL